MKNEKHTRKEIIDQRLKYAGWNVNDSTQVVEEFDISVPLPDGVNEPRTKYEGHQCSDISKEDIRQISGYARMKSIYKELGMEDRHNEVIDCLIIYSDQKADRKNFVKDNFEYVPEDNYVKFYKIGIELPIVKNQRK